MAIHAGKFLKAIGEKTDSKKLMEELTILRDSPKGTKLTEEQCRKCLIYSAIIYYTACEFPMQNVMTLDDSLKFGDLVRIDRPESLTDEKLNAMLDKAGTEAETIFNECKEAARVAESD